jgi:hypothetical protein
MRSFVVRIEAGAHCAAVLHNHLQCTVSASSAVCSVVTSWRRMCQIDEKIGGSVQGYHILCEWNLAIDPDYNSNTCLDTAEPS